MINPLRAASTGPAQSICATALLCASIVSISTAATAAPRILRPGTRPIEIGTMPAPGDFMISFASELTFFGQPLITMANFINPEEGEQRITVGQSIGAPLIFGAGVTFGNDSVARTRPGSDSVRQPASPSSANVVFSISADGSSPNTLAVILKGYDQAGAESLTAKLDDIETTAFPSVGNQNCDVVLRKFSDGAVISYTRVREGTITNELQEIDRTGLPTREPLVISTGLSSVGISRLDANGDRIAVVGAKGQQIVCHIADFSVPVPSVGPEVPVSEDSDGILNFSPCVAGDPDTGNFTCAWVSIGDEDDSNIRCRRFGPLGQATSQSRMVNTTTAGSQNSPCVAYGQRGVSAIAWATGGFLGPDWFDVALQVFDGDGSPIEGEIIVNSDTEHHQAQPEVSFVPAPTEISQPRLGVRYSNIQTDEFGPTGTAIGTGREIEFFLIEGLEDNFPDTDSDGLSDNDETNTYGTDPMNPDTDGDGESDGDEIDLHSTDPLDPKDVFRIKEVSIEEVAGGFTVRLSVPTKAGKNYTLWECDTELYSLRGAVPGQENRPGTDEAMDFITPPITRQLGQESKYYRVAISD